MQIVFLIPYPLKRSPSQRFRFEQYLETLRNQKISYKIYSFYSETAMKILYNKGNTFLKIVHVLSGFMKRVFHVSKSLQADFIFIHREVSPVGPPVFEWLLAKAFHRKLIFDFDDAIWLPDINQSAAFLEKLRCRNKVSSIIRWSHKVSCGNHYLCRYAMRFNDRVFLNPTTIDTLYHHNPTLYRIDSPAELVTIGWTGSHSTLQYLQQVEPILDQIIYAYTNVQFVVIADKKPSLAIKNWKYIEWNEKTEISDLISFDIGIMPLTDDAWSAGKCGFKALQYMALGIPVVLSPVGVNTEIVESGINGFFASDPDQWYRCLETLINDPDLRRRIGEAGRAKVIDHYSVLSNTSTFLSFFERSSNKMSANK